MAASSGEHIANGSGLGYASEDESACSTPFVSAPSSPARDRDTPFSAAFASVPSFSPARDPSFSAAGWFRSAPASPGRGGGGPGCTADEYGRELGFDFDFDFDFSRCPSPAAAAMSSADELFDNGQIRPMRLASLLLRPQVLPTLDGDVPPPPQTPPPSEPVAPPAAAGADERGRVRSRSVRRRYRSLSPFRAHWLSPQPAPAAKSVEPAAAGEAEAAQSAASRSSSSSSTASSASSSSSSSSSRSHHRRWRFLKDILHRSKSSDGGGEHPPSPAPPKRSPSPSPASQGRGRARRSAHARLYESRRAEAKEMRRRTFLPYRQGLPLLGCLGLGSRGYVAMHGLAAAGKARP